MLHVELPKWRLIVRNHSLQNLDAHNGCCEIVDQLGAAPLEGLVSKMDMRKSIDVSYRSGMQCREVDDELYLNGLT